MQLISNGNNKTVQTRIAGTEKRDKNTQRERERERQNTQREREKSE